MKHAVSGLLICKTGGTRLDSIAVYAVSYAAIASTLSSLYHIFASLTGMDSYSCWMLKVKTKFTLEQATKTQRESRGISLLFL
jgi:hypothetical protein